MGGSYAVTDEWTTRDGHLYPTGEMYSIDDEHAKRMEQEQIDGGGCATCFFVKLEGGDAKTVRFYTTAGYTEEHDVDTKGWAHISMYNPGSGYNPNNNVGPWSALAKDASSDVIDGVGLPFGWHVSTFKVLTWHEDQEGGGSDGGNEGGGGNSGDLPATITSVVQVGDVVYRGELTRQGAVG